MSAYRSSFTRSGTLWVIQRVTAAFLVVVLAFHFFLLHFINHAADVTFLGSATRMAQTSYYVTMVLFLITAAFHGLNGVYNALINQGLSGTPRQVVKWVLIIAGLVLIGQGIRLANTLAGGA